MRRADGGADNVRKKLFNQDASNMEASRSVSPAPGVATSNTIYSHVKSKVNTGDSNNTMSHKLK